MEINTDILLELRVEDVLIQKENIGRLLGYDKTDTDPMVSILIDKYLARLPKLITPQAGYVIKQIKNLDTVKGLLELEGAVLNIHRIIASQLKNAGYIAAFTCTIGNTLEQRSRQLMNDGEALEGYILDLIGSQAAEGMAEMLHQKIIQMSRKEGLQASNRFSPGYCGWNVKEQSKLFALFEHPCCGITLNTSALMNPIKSVSGIIGIGENVKFEAYHCSKCSDEHCIYRNRK